MSGVSPIHVWWLAIRPKTLWASVAPVVIGGAMATAVGPLHAPSFIMTLLVALSIQIGTNFSNDYSDFKKGADTDDRQGPLRVTQAGLVTPNQMMSATILVFGGSVLSCAYLVYHSGWAMAVIGMISVLAGVLYTAGPYPLGYLGFGDVSVIVFFGPVAVGGTYFIQTGIVTATVLLSGLAPGLLATAILAVNNLRDLDGDRAVGKRTLAVRFGRTFVRMEYAACILISAAIPLVLVFREDGHRSSILASLALLILAVRPMRKVFRFDDGKTLNPVLAATAKLLLIYSVVFAIGWNTDL